jgi:hypothetical protein
MSATRPTILATSMGFNRARSTWQPSPVFRYAFDLAGNPTHPKLCFLTTGTGDQKKSIDSFYSAFNDIDVDASTPAATGLDPITVTSSTRLLPSLSPPPDPGWPLVERRVPPISSQRPAGPKEPYEDIIMRRPGTVTFEASVSACASVVHLISAQEIDQAGGRTLVAVCGELVADRSCAPRCERDHWYCPQCVRRSAGMLSPVAVMAECDPERWAGHAIDDEGQCGRWILNGHRSALALPILPGAAGCIRGQRQWLGGAIA